jgi:diaminopimelate decarboxylase
LAKVLEGAYGIADRPILILEPGTAVVGASVALVTRVQDVKQVAGRVLALIGASNLCINTMMWKQRLSVAHLRTGTDSTWAHGDAFSLVGNTSAERKDIVCEGLAGPVARGDLVIVDRVGAYSANFKPPFIHMCPPIVARTQGSYEVIKRPETVDDVLATYV